MEESTDATPAGESWSWVVRDGAIQSTGTVPKRDNFKLSCGLPQCPRDRLSGQMSGVTENKFMFPQWKKEKKSHWKKQLCLYETSICTFQSLAGASLKMHHNPRDFCEESWKETTVIALISITLCPTPLSSPNDHESFFMVRSLCPVVRSLWKSFRELGVYALCCWRGEEDESQNDLEWRVWGSCSVSWGALTHSF